MLLNLLERLASARSSEVARSESINAFSTPNSQNVRNLMSCLDFDPFPYWTWSQMGGRGIGSVTIPSNEAASRTDQWVKLRHDIAHGEPRLSAIDLLESVKFAVAKWQSTHPKASHSDALNAVRND